MVIDFGLVSVRAQFAESDCPAQYRDTIKHGRMGRSATATNETKLIELNIIRTHTARKMQFLCLIDFLPLSCQRLKVRDLCVAAVVAFPSRITLFTTEEKKKHGSQAANVSECEELEIRVERSGKRYDGRAYGQGQRRHTHSRTHAHTHTCIREHILCVCVCKSIECTHTRTHTHAYTRTTD